jgi:hypothetical protein
LVGTSPLDPINKLTYPFTCTANSSFPQHQQFN